MPWPPGTAPSDPGDPQHRSRALGLHSPQVRTDPEGERGRDTSSTAEVPQRASCPSCPRGCPSAGPAEGSRAQRSTCPSCNHRSRALLEHRPQSHTLLKTGEPVSGGHSGPKTPELWGRLPNSQLRLPSGSSAPVGSPGKPMGAARPTGEVGGTGVCDGGHRSGARAAVA